MGSKFSEQKTSSIKRYCMIGCIKRYCMIGCIKRYCMIGWFYDLFGFMLFFWWVWHIIPDIGLGVRVFANGPGDLGSIPGRVIPKTQKMVLDASLLNTQHYKVRIKGKVEQFREGVAPSPTPWCSSYRKGSLRVTLDYGRQLYLWHINLCVLFSTKSFLTSIFQTIQFNISTKFSCQNSSLPSCSV